MGKSNKLDDIIKNYREIVEKLEAVKSSNNNEDIHNAILETGGVQNCCGTCITISSIQPKCQSSCIVVSPT